jgi:heptosyltransferase-1
MNFLIVKTSSIGDIVHTFPVAEYLKNRYPMCQIDWIVEEEYASLVQANPHINHVHTLASRRWRRSIFKKNTFPQVTQTISSLKKIVYDAVFDLQGNIKSAFLTQIAKSPKKVGFGWSSSPEWPNYFVTRERFNVDLNLPIQKRYLSVVQQFFKDSEPFEPKGVELQLSAKEQDILVSYRRIGQSRIMVAFASKWENKCLSLPTLIQFLKQVYEQEKCFFYFVSGNVQEKKLADALVEYFPDSTVLQALSFPLWQRLMGEMDLVIAADSAALALCGTTSTPSFSFFGPTLATIYKPLGAQHHHFQAKCPYAVSFSTRCPRLRTCKTGACLKEADSSEIFKHYQIKSLDKSD